MSADQSANFDDQYNALRTGSGFVELEDWSSVTLTGADRRKFLNNFCTNDVNRLTPGQNRETFFCNVKGKITGHGLVTCRNDELVVIGPPGQAAALAAHLDRYVIREDVKVQDTTTKRELCLVAGGRAARDGLANLPYFPWKLIDAEFSGIAELPPGNVPKSVGTLADQGFIACDFEAFNTLRIEAGMPLFGVDFNDQNLPQEVGRNAEAISFTKGCYLGQETVARIDALGHVNQQIVGIAFSGTEIPPVGTELSLNGTSIGRVTSATFSPIFGRPLTLAMVRREHAAVGSKLEAPIGNCEVVALPVRGRH